MDARTAHDLIMDRAKVQGVQTQVGNLLTSLAFNLRQADSKNFITGQYHQGVAYGITKSLAALLASQESLVTLAAENITPGS